MSSVVYYLCELRNKKMKIISSNVEEEMYGFRQKDRKTIGQIESHIEELRFYE